MKNEVILSLFLILIAIPKVYADGIDEVFIKPDTQKNWGTLLHEYSGARTKNVRSFALVIGVSNYKNYPSLQEAKNDPLLIKNLLINDLGYDYVHLLTEEKVTFDRVRRLINTEFRNKISKHDRLLVYWSGHGETIDVANDGQIGLLPTTFSDTSEVSSKIDMDVLRKWIHDWIKAKQTLFLLDACFSGFGGVAKKSSKPKMVIDDLLQQSTHVFTAGTAEQETFVSTRLGGSVFTHAILAGLQGKADVGLDNDEPDGFITVNELEVFTKAFIRRERHSHDWQLPITPTLKVFGSSSGEYFFVSPKSRIGQLEKDGQNLYSGLFEHGVPIPIEKSNKSHTLSPREVTAAIQLSLLKKGYPVGSIDGSFGPITYHAIYQLLLDLGNEDILEGIYVPYEKLFEYVWDALDLSEIYGRLESRSVPSFYMGMGRPHRYKYDSQRRGESLFTTISGYSPSFSASDELIWLLSKHGINNYQPQPLLGKDWIDIGLLDPNTMDLSEMQFEPIFQSQRAETSIAVEPSDVDADLFSILHSRIDNIIYHPVNGEPVKILDIAIAGHNSRKIRIKAKIQFGGRHRAIDQPKGILRKLFK